MSFLQFSFYLYISKLNQWRLLIKNSIARIFKTVSILDTLYQFVLLNFSSERETTSITSAQTKHSNNSWSTSRSLFISKY